MCEASIFLESILKIGNFWNVAFSKVQEKKKKGILEHLPY